MKSWSKRVISAVLVIAMLVTLCPYVAQRMTVEAEERPAGATSTTADGKHVTRGVVDKITELPQYRENIEDYLKNEEGYMTGNKRGTEERPFVVLEIVPDESMAEFGYKISGCEPIDMSKAVGQFQGDLSSRGIITNVRTYNPVYFFPDEPECEYPKMQDYGGNDGSSSNLVGNRYSYHRFRGGIIVVKQRYVKGAVLHFVETLDIPLLHNYWVPKESMNRVVMPLS